MNWKTAKVLDCLTPGPPKEGYEYYTCDRSLCGQDVHPALSDVKNFSNDVTVLKASSFDRNAFNFSLS